MDNNEEVAAVVPEEKKKKRKAMNVLPRKDADLSSIFKRVSLKWRANPSITLTYATQDEFVKLVEVFDTSYSEQLDVSRNRMSITYARKQMDKEINLAVREVKVYIEKKYKKKNALPHFSRFGIQKYKGGYVFPKDKDVRLGALPLMIKGIEDDGFGNEEYGTTFWQKMLDDYNNNLKESSDILQKVTKESSAKNIAKKELNKILTSLLFVLRGNYPSTYKSVYVVWGF